MTTKRIERQLQEELYAVFRELIERKRLDIGVILEEGKSDLLGKYGKTHIQLGTQRPHSSGRQNRFPCEYYPKGV